MNFIKFHSEKNFIISGVCLSGVCLVRSLSLQEFVFPEFVFQEFVTAPLNSASDWLETIQAPNFKLQASVTYFVYIYPLFYPMHSV